MNRKAIYLVAFIAFAGLSAWLWFSSTRAEDGTGGASVGALAPTFTLEDQSGKKVSLADFAGKIVVLEWVNPDCPFVQRHYKAKTMITLAEKYRPKGVIWLAINTTRYMNKDTNKQWVAQHRLPYPILDDHLGHVGKLYGAKTTPHMFIIDQLGKLVYAGAIDDDPGGIKGKEAVNYVERALEELLAGKPVSQPQTKPYGCTVKYAD